MCSKGQYLHVLGFTIVHVWHSGLFALSDTSNAILDASLSPWASQHKHLQASVPYTGLELLGRPISKPGSMCAQVATLRSAVRLEQEQQFLIAKKLQELTGSKNIKLKPVIDESLIAGFIVEYGSSQIDLSVKGQLDKITMELTQGQLATA